MAAREEARRSRHSGGRARPTSMMETNFAETTLRAFAARLQLNKSNETTGSLRRLGETQPEGRKQKPKKTFIRSGPLALSDRVAARLAALVADGGSRTVRGAGEGTARPCVRIALHAGYGQLIRRHFITSPFDNPALSSATSGLIFIVLRYYDIR